MTVEALPAPAMRASRARLDLSGLVMALFAAALCLLVVLPIAWLVVFAFTDRARNVTLANFVTLFTDPVVPRAARHHARHRHVRQPHLLPRRRAHGLDRGAHRHSLQPHHPHAGDGLVRDAAVPRRHRLGAAGGAQQRPSQPALSRRHRRRPGRGAVQHLHAHRPDLRHLLLHLPLRVRAGRQCARPHPRRPRGRLRHAGRQRLAHGAAGDDPAGAAGAGRRRAGRLPAGHDAVRLAGDPGAARRLPHHDHQDLEPVPVPAQAGAGRRRRPAAARADRGAAARAGVRAGTARLYGGRRQERRAAPRAARMAALAGAARLLRHALPARVSALRRAGERRLLAHCRASC